MSRNRRRKSGKSNEQLLKDVLGEKYVSQHHETTSEKSEPKNKRNSSSQRAPTASTANKKEISVTPTVSFVKEEASSVTPPKELIEKVNITSHLPIKEQVPDVQQVSLPQESVSVNQQKLPSKVPMPSGISTKKLKELLHATKRFISCDDLRLDFIKKRITIKKNGIYHVITFEGDKILSYTFHGKNIVHK